MAHLPPLQYLLMSLWTTSTSHHRRRWFPGCHVQWSNPLCPSRDDPLRVARRYTWCSHGPPPIPPCLQCPYSGRWHHPTWWSSCHPPFGKGQGAAVYPWRPPRNIQMPIPCPPMHLLAWHKLRHQTCYWSMYYMPVPLPTGTSTAAQANPSPWMPMATPWSWLHALWWQWVPHHHGLLLKNALCP